MTSAVQLFPSSNEAMAGIFRSPVGHRISEAVLFENTVEAIHKVHIIFYALYLDTVPLCLRYVRLIFSCKFDIRKVINLLKPSILFFFLSVYYLQILPFFPPILDISSSHWTYNEPA